MEESLKYGFGTGGLGGKQGLAVEEEPAEAVGNGEGVTIKSIAGFELPFEVGAPEIVGCEDGAGGLSGMTDMATVARFRYHAVTLHDVTDGGAARQIPSRVALMDDREELLSAPGGMAAAGFEERLYDLGCGFIRRLPGSSRAFLETRGPKPQIAVDPFIGGLAGDVVELAELRNGQSFS